MKKPMLAFTLNFFLPGAGLAYLGKWKWAAINLGVVLALGLILAFIMPEDFFVDAVRYLAMACFGGSGGLAYTLARRMNEERKNGENPAKTTM